MLDSAWLHSHRGFAYLRIALFNNILNLKTTTSSVNWDVVGTPLKTYDFKEYSYVVI
jgi:hypothetical protein